MINKESLYKLPFTKYNNAEGWIEPTTFCQLKCPHCYRGTDRDDFKPSHREKDDVLKEIDNLIRMRNIQILTISGGEPLLYPYLDDLIKYAVKNNLTVVINTNGILLDKKRLVELKKLGVTRMFIHIDKYQGREGCDTEARVNKLRENFCNLFREVNGITLGFFLPVSKDNLEDLKIVIPFFKKNTDVIKACIFPALSEVFPDKKFPDNKAIDRELIFEKIKEIYGLEYCSYLGKELSDGFGWLFACNIFAGEKYLGSVDKDMAKYIQDYNYRKEKRWVLVSKSNPRSLSFFTYLLINKSTRRIIINYFKNFLRGKISEQVITAVSSPQLVNGKYDMCDGCPNAILYDGDFVPSCLLERIKNGENISLNKLNDNKR